MPSDEIWNRRGASRSREMIAPPGTNATLRAWTQGAAAPTPTESTATGGANVFVFTAHTHRRATTTSSVAVTRRGVAMPAAGGEQRRRIPSRQRGAPAGSAAPLVTKLLLVCRGNICRSTTTGWRRVDHGEDPASARRTCLSTTSICTRASGPSPLMREVPSPRHSDGAKPRASSPAQPRPRAVVPPGPASCACGARSPDLRARPSVELRPWFASSHLRGVWRSCGG